MSFLPNNAKICDTPGHNEKLCVQRNPQKVAYEKGFGIYLFDRMKEHGTKSAMVDISTGEEQSYDTLLSRCRKIAKTLQDRGVTSEDVVSVCTGNNMDAYATMLASLFICAKYGPLDPSLSKSDTVYLCNLLQPKIIFCDAEGEKLIDSVFDKIENKFEVIVYGDSEKYGSFSKFVACDADNFIPTPPKDVHDTAVILMTSGTTGNPKGVCLSHYSLLQTYANSMVFTKTYMALSRLFWLTASGMAFAAIHAGGRWMNVTTYDADRIAEAIEIFKINLIYSSSYIASTVSRALDKKNYDTSSVALYCIIGTQITEKTILKLRRQFGNGMVNQSYGMTEANGSLTMFGGPSEKVFMDKKPTSCGRVIPGVCIKIVDVHTGKLCGKYEKGELRFKTDHLMNGYYNNPEETKKMFDEDGYFCSGDLLYYDEDYCLHFVERIKDMIKYRSWTVFPHLIEQELLTHPNVLEACVFGIPHKDDGELITAAVVLKHESQTSPEELIEYVNERVSDTNRIRGGLKILDSIPKTISQKSSRKLLENMYKERKI